MILKGERSEPDRRAIGVFIERKETIDLSASSRSQLFQRWRRRSIGAVDDETGQTVSLQSRL